ncbi:MULTISPECIES: ribose-phosphate diphosphokinase [unclassified Tenacibaculum]|uniref:ribose-phosphate diphosphokinase n=1 Tax=unclassified Tenacibaculum TaxID=2635139 RepID=UPI001F40C1E3|nr:MULTISPECIES: ribose-phosphate diphosphokinase [unclassified Tenacibaculum]MCF2873479.1 ribose-phosphate diphosphokinase [Tenacibaculum sp. Cn5-1]MCF2933635.1 ribose-phosphate diphosphokinase [Tenacibaculum sp. Cn5-34]MCG7509783.1 ribose-phosphate diphosphokinase [Tenacibaculum sp. Cn5-46]
MILNLDKHFSPYGTTNTIEYNYFTFSGGEPHIKIITDLKGISEVTITHRIQSFNDLGILLLATNALKNMDVKKIKVLLPYFPAARQDRLMQTGEPLSVKVYADIINAQNYESVTIFDPHSEVTPAVLNNCKVIDNHSFIRQITQQLPDDLLLISPDGGALKKIYKVAAHLQKYEVIEGSKSRNVRTGELTGFKVYAEDLKGKDCLIVDDICDGGGTFLGLAQELKAKNAGNLYLAVSHGIFSRGFEDLEKVFTKIYTTDSFKTIAHKNCEQIELKEILRN